jgi:UDP-N-acetylmuramate dehydrogenase
VVSAAKYEELKLKFPGIIGYPSVKGIVKLAAGWMIEQCGWKGYRRAMRVVMPSRLLC